MPNYVAPMIGRGVALLTPTADGSANQVIKTNGSGVLSFTTVSGTVPVHVADGRLTTESGVPISTSDRASQSTLYYTPHIGNQIALYDGSSTWTLNTFTERSLALSGLTSGKNYDVFLYDNSGTLTLELSAAWTNDTTRADALTTQDGVYVKSGATTRRYLGTIRTTGTTTTEDSLTKRFVWNVENRVHRALEKGMGSSSHTYTSATVRQYNADATAQVELVVGLIGGEAQFGGGNLCSVSAGGILGRIGVGENSTTTFITTANNVWTVTSQGNPIVVGHTTPRVGYSVYSLNEQNQSGTGTVTYDFGRIWGMLAC